MTRAEYENDASHICTLCGGAGFLVSGFPENIRRSPCLRCEGSGRKNAQQAFEEFLKLSGCKCGNLSDTLGGPTADTPWQKIYVMMVPLAGSARGGAIYKLGGREEAFVFNASGELLFADAPSEEDSRNDGTN